MSNLFTIWLAFYGARIASKERLPTRYVFGEINSRPCIALSFIFSRAPSVRAHRYVSTL